MRRGYLRDSNTATTRMIVSADPSLRFVLPAEAAFYRKAVLRTLHPLLVSVPHHRMRLEPAFEIAAPEHFLNELFRRRAMMPLGVLNHLLFQDQPVAEPGGEQAGALGAVRAVIGVAGAGIGAAQAAGEGVQAGETGLAGGNEMSGGVHGAYLRRAAGLARVPVPCHGYALASRLLGRKDAMRSLLFVLLCTVPAVEGCGL